MSDTFSLEGTLAYNIDFENLTTSAKATYGVTDSVSLVASVGHSEHYDHNFWSVGAEYAVSEGVSLSAAYHGNADSVFNDPGLVLGISTQF